MLLLAPYGAEAMPLPPTPPAETSAKAAVDVVRRYYAALGRRDYRGAYRLWHGRLSYPAFRAGYARTARTRVTPLPPFTTEGGCGSSYSEVRVRVDARLVGGTTQRFLGSYTLRRVNDIDGSTAAQRRWHIVGATLRAVPAGG